MLACLTLRSVVPGMLHGQYMNYTDIFAYTMKTFSRSWHRASLMYSSMTNKMQRYTVVFVTTYALHVSGGSSAHHQELKTVHTASGIYRTFSASYRYPTHSR